jgi:hypothetical protein
MAAQQARKKKQQEREEDPATLPQVPPRADATPLPLAPSSSSEVLVEALPELPLPPTIPASSPHFTTTDIKRPGDTADDDDDEIQQLEAKLAALKAAKGL